MTEDSSPYRADVLSGKVALITGGGSGIGLEIARQLGLHGACVMLMGRREAVLADAKAKLEQQGIRAGIVRGDVRLEESGANAIKTTVDQFGHLDILINSAAGNFLATADDISTNAFRTVVDIDTVGTFNMCKSALGALKESKGLIINISATIQYPATYWQTHAAAAKCAIDSLTRSLALEWGEYGIRVNGIAPGPISNTVGMAKLAPTQEAINHAFLQAVPLKKLGVPWDCAMAALYYASSSGRFITGDTIVVDGGQQLWRPALLPRKAVSKESRKVEAHLQKKPTSKL